MTKQLIIDNSRPDDDSYPTSEPSETAYQPKTRGDQWENCIVNIGDYVVNREGDIVIATTSNAGPYPNEFLRGINEGCFRAKYIGREHDYLELANQSRLATPEEIELAKKYVRKDSKVTAGGQVVLL